MPLSVSRTLFVTLLFALSGLTTFSLSAQAQFSIPGVKIPGLPEVNVPGMDTLFKEEEPVTTSIKDARGEVAYLDSYSPETVKPLSLLKRGPNGGWLLKPGLYGGEIHSYCLHAGTYGPTHGNGYLYAPLKGKRRSMIQKILHNSADHPDLSQQDIQSLLWAIEARAKFDALPQNLQQVAAILLPPQDILDLNGASLDYMNDEVKNQAFGSLNATLRPIYEAQNNLRGLLTQASLPFDQLESVAVLTGDPPRDSKGRDIPRGRWTLHPGGFFVRYLPGSYSRTTLQLYVPEHFSIKRDTQGRILSVLDADGDGVETDYSNTAAPLPTTDHALQGYAFAAIRLIKKGKPIQECKNEGWTFAGIPNGKNVQCAAAAGYPDSETRLQELVTLMRQMEDFKKNGDKSKSDWGNPRDVIDLASYRSGIEKALQGCDAAAAPSSEVQIFEPQLFELLIHAWQWEDCHWANEPPGDSDLPEYDPSQDVATPGENGRQRLGQSCVLFSSAGP